MCHSLPILAALLAVLLAVAVLILFSCGLLLSSCMAKEQAAKPFDPAMLKPGDCLLYTRTPWRASKLGWFFGMVINIKTWSRFSHVEIYKGGGYSMASRDGIGVDLFPLRVEQLAKVRRPGPAYSHSEAKAWFETVKGQKYDWLGLLCFTLAVKQGAQDKMFCSEYGVRHYRRGGLAVINPKIDADKASPAQLDMTTELEDVWEAE